jgi:hypothetical protein
MTEQTGNLPRIPLTLLLRDEYNRVRGGIRGQIALYWLQVDHFWVDETLRGQGYAEIGRLKDRPPGRDRIWMAERWG